MRHINEMEAIHIDEMEAEAEREEQRRSPVVPAAFVAVALFVFTGCQSDEPHVVTDVDNHIIDVHGTRWDIQLDDSVLLVDAVDWCNHSGGEFIIETWVCQDIDY